MLTPFCVLLSIAGNSRFNMGDEKFTVAGKSLKKFLGKIYMVQVTSKYIRQIRVVVQKYHLFMERRRKRKEKKQIFNIILDSLMFK